MINGLDYGEVSPRTHFRVFLQEEEEEEEVNERRRKEKEREGRLD